jgi:hypothetical protein
VWLRRSGEIKDWLLNSTGSVCPLCAGEIREGKKQDADEQECKRRQIGIVSGCNDFWYVEPSDIHSKRVSP